MSKTLKWTLVAIAAFLALCSGAVGLGMWWVGSGTSTTAASGRDAQGEGTVFGTGRTADNCLEEALRRAAGCKDKACLAAAKAFAHGCFQAAPPTPSQCAGAPPEAEVAESVRWVGARCVAARHGDDPRCEEIAQALRAFCRLRAGEPP